MNQPVICTIIAKNYLAQARCLTESFLNYHPNGKVFVLFADKIDNFFNPNDERFISLEAEDLGIPNFDQMAFRYTVLEFNTAVKPYLLEYLFLNYNLKELCYFDPDIYFYQPINNIISLLQSNSVVLTPHLLEPLNDDLMPDEPYILRAGVYNLGFIGLSWSENTNKLLQWWKKKLERDCVVDSSRGLFVDQRWIDLLPAFFEDVAILRDPGHNTAYWNLKSRNVFQEDNIWRVNEGPLTFYHFSGLPMKDINSISKHQNRYKLDDIPQMKPLFHHYHSRINANGYNTVISWPYAYNNFNNGVKIIDAARHLWRNLGAETRWPNPFDTEHSDSFFHWLNQGVTTTSNQNLLITNLAMEIYRQRWDLQQAFPDVLDTHAESYIAWFIHSAEEQYDIDPAFITPLLTQLEHYRSKVNIQQIERTVSEKNEGNNRITQTVKTTLVKIAQPKQIIEAPLIGKPTLKRRAYYAVRNPLRILGLHEPVKQLLGKQVVEQIYARMVSENTLLPELMTRNASEIPNHVFYSLPKHSDSSITGVNVIGYLRAETGMGEVPRSILRALESINYPIAQYDLSNSEWARSNDLSVLHIQEGNPFSHNLLCVNADMLPHVFQQLGSNFFKGKYNIGFWHWETNHFPEEWYDRFKYLDEIWVDSGFVQKTLSSVSPIPIVNIPLSVNAMKPTGLSRNAIGIPEEPFTFLFSFDMLSFIQRKNPYAIIDAYKKAFGTKNNDVSLVVKVNNLDKFPEDKRCLSEKIDEIGGILIDRYMNRDELAALFENCDSYISLHRSEGFGLTIAEAMAMGKPVIATAYSGNMEFMNPSNSYMVGYSIDSITEDYGPYRAGDEWANPDIDHAAELMISVYRDRTNASKKGLQAAEDMRKYFSSSYTADKIKSRLLVTRNKISL